MFRVSALLAAVGLALASAAGAADYKPPRTAAGTPDLQGVWDSLTFTFLERSSRFKAVVVPEAEAQAYEREMNDVARAEASIRKARPNAPNVGLGELQWLGGKVIPLARIAGQARSSILIDPADGRLPMLPATRARLRDQRRQEARNFESFEARPLDERCMFVPGPPMVDGYDLEIVQTPDYVVININVAETPRIVRLIDRRHGPAELARWMGDSVGWWDGDTLVVETTHFNAAANQRTVAPLSADAKVIERFSRTAPGEILYRFTVNDPANYSGPWSGVMPLTAAKGRLFPYECHEGNYSLPNILAGARRVEREGGTPEPLDGGDPPSKAVAVSSAPAPAASPRPASPPAP